MSDQEKKEQPEAAEAKSAEEKPATEAKAEAKPPAEKPAEAKAEAKPPAEKPAEAKAEARPPAEKPAEAKPEAKPAEAKAEAKPVEAKAEAKAEAKSLDEKLAAATGTPDEKERLDPKAAKQARKEKKAKAQEKAGKSAKGSKAGGGKKGKAKGGKKKKEKREPFVKRTAPPRLRAKYDNEIVSALTKEFGYRSRMAVPRLLKITLNMGLGEALQNPKLIESAQAELTDIAGQKPVVTRARQSIAAFKLRQGQKIGCMVTLRRDRMYEFLDRLVSFALPRTRDFRGISPRSFDGRGNFALGIKEQIIFSEIDYDKIEKIMGLNISIVTSAKTDEEGRALLKHLGMPFRK